MPSALQAPSVVVGRRALLAGTGLLLVGRLARAASSEPVLLEAAPRPGGAAFNGGVPGPTLRVRLGEPVELRLANHLAAPVAVIFDGVRNTTAVAGTPVPPGGGGALRFVPPDAGTFQYRAAGPDAAAQTAGGLRGVFIVDEAAPPAVDADLLLALGDNGAAPDRVLVNGKAAAMTAATAPNARVRLRIVNGCVARIAVVALTGARPSVVAVDGQPSALFQPAAGTIPIGPGARFDLMVDMPAAAGSTVGATLRGDGGRPDVPLLMLTTAGRPLASRPPIAALPENPRLPSRIALEKASRHTVTIAAAPGDRWTVNGISGGGSRPLFAVRRGTPVVLTLENRTALVQPLQVAGQCWRILHDLDDGWDPYWRNSLLLAPGKTKHVAFVPDESGRWSLGGGDLRRAAAGLAATFEVL